MPGSVRHGPGFWETPLLEEAIELCGVTHELTSDNGTPFVAIVRSMLSRFQRR
jgi:hypothetical protein